MLTREEIINTLKQGPHQVLFNKVSGEQRSMKCTLNESLIPDWKDRDTTNALNTKKIRDINPNVVVAYDLEKNDWRSFRVENLIQINSVQG